MYIEHTIYFIANWNDDTGNNLWRIFIELLIITEKNIYIHSDFNF